MNFKMIYCARKGIITFDIVAVERSIYNFYNRTWSRFLNVLYATVVFFGIVDFNIAKVLSVIVLMQRFLFIHVHPPTTSFVCIRCLLRFLWIYFDTERYRFFTQVFLACNSKLRYNDVTEGSCQSESEAKICIETLTGTQ